MDPAAQIKLADRRLRISQEGLYWQHRDAKGVMIRDKYPLKEWAKTLNESGFRCESSRRISGQASTELIQKVLRINEEGFYWKYKSCKKLLIFNYKCEMKLETYLIMDWAEKLREMGFVCFRREI